ncbi:MAG TPA: PKD domain-containing protein [Actinospica sp.]|jgi:parallel beta-helix repeat protein|nr:PKD domain-containing protein [Actinospica sp.]
MARIRRVAATAAFVIGSSAFVGATAHATASTVIWVDNASGAGCADAAGSGSQAAPYCTIQAAVDVAQAGDTVKVEPGVYKAQNTITTSGTASEPITIEAESQLAPVMIYGSFAHAFDVSGASHIVITGFDLGGATAEPVLVSGSSDVTIQKLIINNEFETAGFENDQIHVTGASSGIDISQNVLGMSTTTAVQIDAGGSNDIVTTNILDRIEGYGILVASTPGTTIVSNTVNDTCDSGIALKGTSTGATIENNIVADTLSSNAKVTCPTLTAPVAGLEVDSTATSGTTANYNDIDSAEDAVVDYNWGGTTYATAAALNTATGQGAMDANTAVLPDTFFGAPNGPTTTEPSEKSAAINSANSGAPDELATDIYGDARVNDPLVADTGAGTYSYYDRGAVQRQDTVSLPNLSYPQVENAAGNVVSQAPTGAPISMTNITASSSWGGSMTYTVDFGDGSASVPATNGRATHTYTAAGNFNIDMTARSSYGGETGFGTSIQISNAAPDPQLTVTSTGALSVSVDASKSTDPWSLYDYNVDFGDGYQSGSVNAGTTSIPHTYAKAGTYTITLTLQDSGGDNAQTTASYTTAGSDFTAYGPTRILDTRKGTGTGGVIAKVPGMSSITVKVGGTGSIPANATAVALNLTETNATGGGNIAVYPTGQTKPTTSNLNYGTGMTRAANVIVGLGTNGEVTLGNSAPTTSSVDLVADVAGYFTQTSAAGYQPEAPTRILDTRKGTGEAGGKAAKVAAGGTLAVNVGAPAGTTAVVMNLTETNDPVGGYITAYPSGESRPVASSLNFAAKDTDANTVVVPVGPDGDVELYNYSPQPVDLIADVEGYFTSSATAAFTPVTPTRLYDSRTTSAPVSVGQVVTVQPSQKDQALPSTAAAYVYNVTITAPTGGGFVSAYPAGTTRPNASNVNFGPGQTVANSAFTEAGSGGADSFYNGSTGTVQLIVDAFGYFTSN